VRKKKILVSWSSGKDCAWALHVLRQQNQYEIAGLLTTVNAEFDRVAMHGTRKTVLEAQAAAAQLPLWTIPLPWPCSNDAYESQMRAACERARSEGIEAVAFGDLFLPDVRAYRERQMAETGLEPLFPLWKIPTNRLAHEMQLGGLKASVVCVNTKVLPQSFAGCEFNDEFVKSLPNGVDPCGENGEFHSCVYGGPMFAQSLKVRKGETVVRDGFAFSDLGLCS
jgi:uncharacterized protein (TIGR00290 family)